MNAELRAVKNSTEQALSAAYAEAKAKLPGDSKVVALRDAAAARFEALGLPHRRIEEWKYTDLRSLLGVAKPIARPRWTVWAPVVSSMPERRNAI